jgi:hypothetical protein
MKKRKKEEAQKDSPLIEKRLEFLNNKKVLYGKETKDIYYNLINYPEQAPSEDRVGHYKACQGRLDRILRIEGDKTDCKIPYDVQSFDAFCKIVGEWSCSKNSYVFHRDHPKVSSKDVLVQRAQLSGLCYIHGPDMLQHYLVSMNSDKAGMIDISKLIHDTFDAKQLEEHIFNDHGGSSDVMLKYILEPNSVIASTDILNIEERLQEHGPLLVARFQVHVNFHEDNGTFIYHGKPEGKTKGLHAMILIGTRKDGNGKRLFLLQNWWKQKQFVEVDEEYLGACEPILFFVRTPQFSIPEEFPTNFAFYAENENLDKPESVPAFEGPLKGVYDCL